MEQKTPWRKCNACKKDISLGGLYYVCSVSTCNGQRTGYTFCSVPCFDTHVPIARHKDAGAVEMKAPLTAQTVRTIARPAGSVSNMASPNEVLVITSRLKEYISARSNFNTSTEVVETLSDYLRILCERAIDNARADGRKTVMGRDFEFLKDSKR